MTKVTANDKKASASSKYGRIARVYELGASLGSGGQIQISKKHHLTLLRKPSSILYPGAGIAIEVAEAAKQGHAVTVVELDPTMLELAKAYFKEHGVADKVNCIQGSILDHQGSYDVVVANYFLDVFDSKFMPTVFRHLVSLLKKDGLMCFSGYAPMHGSTLHKAIQWINHFYANFFTAIVVNNATHPIYDYATMFDDMGLKQEYVRDFKHFGSFGPRFHRMWAARKI